MNTVCIVDSNYSTRKWISTTLSPLTQRILLTMPSKTASKQRLPTDTSISGPVDTLDPQALAEALDLFFGTSPMSTPPPSTPPSPVLGPLELAQQLIDHELELDKLFGTSPLSSPPSSSPPSPLPSPRTISPPPAPSTNVGTCPSSRSAT